MADFDCAVRKETENFRIHLEFNNLCGAEEAARYIVSFLFTGTKKEQPLEKEPVERELSFRDFLKMYREEHGMSQMEMSKILGVSSATVSNWEAGRADPHPQVQKEVYKRLASEVELL